MADDDIEIIYSPYCGSMSDKTGETFDIHIYKADFEKDWLLELVDQAETSFCWEDRFETDKLAYQEAVKSLTEAEKFNKENWLSLSC